MWRQLTRAVRFLPLPGWFPYWQCWIAWGRWCEGTCLSKATSRAFHFGWYECKTTPCFYSWKRCSRLAATSTQYKSCQKDLVYRCILAFLLLPNKAPFWNPRLALKRKNDWHSAWVRIRGNVTLALADQWAAVRAGDTMQTQNAWISEIWSLHLVHAEHPAPWRLAGRTMGRDSLRLGDTPR